MIYEVVGEGFRYASNSLYCLAKELSSKLDDETGPLRCWVGITPEGLPRLLIQDWSPVRLLVHKIEASAEGYEILADELRVMKRLLVGGIVT